MRFLKPALLAALFCVWVPIGIVGCSHKDDAPAPVAPSIATVPANQTVLEGATATFTVVANGTAPLTYQWKRGTTAVTGATAAAYTTAPTVLADSGASFTVTVTNSAGTITSPAATLTVNPAPPTIATQPANVTVLAGAQATFTVVAAGSAPLAYQWKKGGADLAGATGASFTTAATALADNGSSFTVAVTNGVGTLTSNPAILTVEAAPVFTSSPVGGTVLAGVPITFTATATGNPAPTYQWYKDAVALAGKTSASLTLASPVLADAGSYTVKASNSRGTATSGAALLVVNQGPVIATQPANQTVLVGNPATFTVVVTGVPAVTYQWSRNGVAVAGATSATYTTPATVVADNGASYTVAVSNSIGSLTSNAAILTVETVPAFTTSPVGGTVLAGVPITFTADATGNPAPTYQWYKDAVALTGKTSASLTLASPTLADAGSYTVKATNSRGTVTSSAAVLVVNQAPVIVTQPANQSVFAGNPATFTVVATGFPAVTYQWRKDGVAIGGATSASYTLSPTVLADAGVYSVVLTNSIGAVTSANATLTVTVGPGFLTQPLSQTVLLGSSVTFTVTVSGTPTPTVQWVKDGLNLPGATALSYTIPAVGVADAGTYAAVASNAQGNVTSQGAVLTVRYAPIIDQQPQAQNVGNGATAVFNVTAHAVPAITGYQWRYNGVNITGATGATLTLTNVTVSNNGAYDVVVTNPVGSTTSAAATLTVALTYSISGHVSVANSGQALAGVTISINTTPVQTTVTNSNGDFTLAGLANGTYILTPSITSASGLFFPATLSATIASASVSSLQFQAALGYSLSGTALYSGTKTGRIYLRLDPMNGGDSLGVSIPGPGNFTIRGVPSGSYNLNAWMDTIGYGYANAANPRGTASVLVVGNATGQNLNLADPGAISLTGANGPAIQGAAPYSGGAVIFYSILRDVNGNETADTYLLEASTSSSFTTIAATLTFKAQADSNKACFIHGLTNGQAYYFRMKAKAGATTSNPGTATTAVTIGNRTGGNTVSGSLTFPGTATGPLAVGLYDETSGQMYLVSYPSPVSPQVFSIAGVPNGTYFLFGILDQNQNGIIDPGDLSNTNNNSSAGSVTVAGDLPGKNFSLSNAGAIATMGTNHQRNTAGGTTAEYYSLKFNVDGNAKLPVNVSLQTGGATLDLGKPSQGSGYWYSIFLNSFRPTIGTAVTIHVAYSDGTAEDFPVQVTTVLDAFPTNLAPVTGGSNSVTPTFSWAAPVPAVTFPYTYSLWLGSQTGNGSWNIDGLLSTTLSIGFNSDGRASIQALTPGVPYSWSVSLRDAGGNEAQQQVVYQP